MSNNSQITYKEFAILIDHDQAQPYSVAFDAHEGDFGDYDSIADAKKAINRFWAVNG